MEPINIQVIARMRSDFATKFGIPRQSGLGSRSTECVSGRDNLKLEACLEMIWW